jgi:hypothetical protein
VNTLDRGAFFPQAVVVGTIGQTPQRVVGRCGCSILLAYGRSAEIQILFMGSLKKRRKAKINKHKRRKKLRAHRHKKRTWQK